MYESKDKMVSHPGHYQSETGLEVIDAIEAFTFDLKGIEAVDTGNVLKYICRWKKKNGLQDLEKAKWYLEHLIEHVSKLEEENKPICEHTFDPQYTNEMRFSFENEVDALMCRSKVDDLFKEYGHVTVNDIYDIIGDPNIERIALDYDYGWLDLSKVNILYSPNGGYTVLVFPKPKRLM